MSLEIKFKCFTCSKMKDIDDSSMQCEACTQRDEIHILREAIIDVAEKSYHWEDRDFPGFTNEKEKDIYLKGVHYGYKKALFWMADYYGEVEFWENLTEQKKC